MRRTTVPMTVIGQRKDGRPIYLIQGGSDDAGGQGAAGGGEAGGTGSGGSGNQAGGQTGEGGQTGGTGTASTTSSTTAFDHITDPAELRAIAVRLTNEAAQSRTKSRDQVASNAAAAATKDLTDKIAEALGLKAKPADPEALNREIAALKADTAERDRELAIYRAALAPGMNVNVGRLLDSRTFMRTMADIDPTRDDAESLISDRIKSAVSSDPSLQAVRVNGGGSVGHAGGAGDHQTTDLSKLHGTTLVEAAYASNASGK